MILTAGKWGKTLKGDAKSALAPGDSVQHAAHREPAVLVHLGNARNTMLIARDLVRRGVRVEIACSSPCAAARWMAHVSAFHRVPDIHRCTEAFVRTVGEICRSRQIDLFLPSLHEVFVLAPFRDALRSHTSYPFATAEVIRRVDDKIAVSHLAECAGLAVPRFEEVTGGELARFDPPSGFPVVYKPVIGSAARGFGIADNREQLLKALRRAHRGERYLVQEFVPGTLSVWEGIFSGGRTQARFQFEVLRTRPAAGGASVLRRSIKLPDLDRQAERLLHAVGYEGFCTLDFIREAGSGKLFFIDFNPRFGTSLHASLAGGISFPYLLLQLARNEPVTPPEYQSGVLSLSLAGHVRRLFSGGRHGPGFPRRLAELLSCLPKLSCAEESWLGAEASVVALSAYLGKKLGWQSHAS